VVDETVVGQDDFGVSDMLLQRAHVPSNIFPYGLQISLEKRFIFARLRSLRSVALYIMPDRL
jgi:hypothetical protein